MDVTYYKIFYYLDKWLHYIDLLNKIKNNRSLLFMTAYEYYDICIIKLDNNTYVKIKSV